MNTMIGIGKKIKKIRKENGLTQEMLALQCDISKPTLIGIERGQGNVTIDNLIKILQVLGLQIDLIEKPILEKRVTLSDLKQDGIHQSPELSGRIGFKLKS